MSDARKTFEARDSFLLSIGFQNYDEYLQSDLWESIKNSLRQHSESLQCICCKSKVGLCWHHRDYSPFIMVGNFSFASGLVVRICASCHKAIHFSDGKRVPLCEANERLATLADFLRHPSGVSYREHIANLDHSEFDAYSDFQTPSGFK